MCLSRTHMLPKLNDYKIESPPKIEAFREEDAFQPMHCYNWMIGIIRPQKQRWQKKQITSILTSPGHFTKWTTKYVIKQSVTTIGKMHVQNFVSNMFFRTPRVVPQRIFVFPQTIRFANTHVVCQRFVLHAFHRFLFYCCKKQFFSPKVIKIIGGAIIDH